MNYNSKNQAHTYSSDCQRLMAEFFQKSSRIVLLPSLPGKLLPLSEQESGIRSLLLTFWIQEHSVIAAIWGPEATLSPTAPTSDPLWAWDGHWNTAGENPKFPGLCLWAVSSRKWALVDSVSCKGLKDWATLQLETWQQNIQGSPTAGQEGIL